MTLTVDFFSRCRETNFDAGGCQPCCLEIISASDHRQIKSYDKRHKAHATQLETMPTHAIYTQLFEQLYSFVTG